MPSFAEMITGNAMKSVQDARDPNAGSGVVGGMQIGANLAIEQQKNQMMMKELQQKQQQLKMAQLDKYVDANINIAKMPDGPDKSAAQKNFLPQMGQALQVGDMVHPLAQDMMNKNPALNNFVLSGIKDGSIPPAVLGDPEQVIKLASNAKVVASADQVKSFTENYPKDVQDSYKQFLANKNAKEVANIKSGSINERNIVSQHEHALAEISNPNSQVQKSLGAAQSITNSYKAFAASGGMGAEFEQFQNQLRLNQGSSAAARSGVAERAKAHASSLGISAQQYIQMATGQVQNVENASPELVKAMKEVGKIETQQITKQADDALTRAEKGRKGFYDQVGGYKAEDYKARINETRDQLKSISSGYGGGKINFAGHDWTPEQLKSKIDSLKGSTDAATVKRLKEAQDAYDAGVK